MNVQNAQSVRWLDLPHYEACPICGHPSPTMIDPESGDDLHNFIASCAKDPRFVIAYKEAHDRHHHAQIDGSGVAVSSQEEQ